ncbi:uncharacterized protein CIMG_02820 [Coccidioides immitis RS]|uniref:Uncharacterized protein n=1 Tax=Coccidioides immitis (strain RS) TaxID=246410 RepID=J3KM67_COCIM|nr:uncharacterized protein CIMG_02820 [Coccidioides immitis RS]EAS37466.3 hypothetical protein CIMG_02820 [Coccidioides immitis RS]
MISTRYWFHIGAITATLLLALILPDRKSIFGFLAGEEIEISKIVVETVVSSAPPGTVDRHQEEKQFLLQRLRRPNGELSQYHPRRRLLAALHGFYRYATIAMNDLNTISTRYKSLPDNQKRLIELTVKYDEKIRQTERLIKKNDVIAQKIVDHALEFYGVEFSELQKFVHDVESSGQSAERVSVSQALKHYIRDWAPEGEHERISTFPHILNTLEKLYPKRDRANPVRVLLPGSGLGRLAHDIADLQGFEVTANEWSMYMNVAYRYITSPGGSLANSSTIYPYIDWWSHQPTTAELHRPITFPVVPVDPHSVVLVEGDFTTAFKKPSDQGRFDAVVTLFFIDTARNIVTYIETIHQLLKPGGVWINLGPLLYGSSPVIQLSLDEIIDISEAVGFDLQDTDPQCGDISLPGRKVRQMEAPYGFNKDTLSKNAYWAQFWVATRR